MGLKKQTKKLIRAREKEQKALRKLATGETVTEVTPSHTGARRSPYFPRTSNVNLDVVEANQALRTASGGRGKLKVGSPSNNEADDGN